MMNNQNYKSHIFAALLLFVMGNASLTLPFCRQQNGLFVLLLSSIFGLGFTLVAVPVLNYAFSPFGQKSAIRKAVSYLAAFAVIAAAIDGAVTTFYDYNLFLKSVQLPQTNRVLTAVVAAVLIFVFVSSSDSAIFKFCLLFAVITGAFVIILFAISVKTFDPTALDFKFDFGGKTVLTAFTCFLKVFAPTAVPIAFVIISKRRAGTANVVCGFAAGILGISLCAAQSVLTLGGTAAGYDFPYLYAVSAFSAGDLFIRQDGFVYFVFFSTAITKTALCVKTVWLILKRFFQNKTKNAEDG